MNQPPSQHNSSSASGLGGTGEGQAIEQTISDLEQSLQAIKQRYHQIQQDQQQQAHLQQRVNQLKQELKQQPTAQLKAELTQIQENLDLLEVDLESRLLSWNSLKKPFWQIVRFGGLGLLLGWALAFVTFKSPQPAPTQFAPSQQPTKF